MLSTGAFWFGVVIGYVTYRTLRHKTSSGISDIAAVVGAVGGSAVLILFPTGTASFDHYGIGLAAGFFIYLALSLIIAWGFDTTDSSGKAKRNAANEFLGDS